MDSANESFTISGKETLLPNHQKLPSPTPRIAKHVNLKPLLFLAFLILLILVATFTISFSLSWERRYKIANAYQSKLIRHYCGLTVYPMLCYDSLSRIVNTEALELSPVPIFSTSFQVAASELDDVVTKIGRASASNNSLIGPRLSLCRRWAQDSLALLDVNLSIETLTSVEMSNVTRAWNLAAAGDHAAKCSSALREAMMEGEEVRVGVEGVKLGVEKAIKCMVNSIGLLEKRQYIVYDFYDSPHSGDDLHNYDDPFDFYINSFTICLYSAMYICLALLCFLLCRLK